MRTLSSHATARKVRGDLVPVDLVRLVLYSDKPAGTIDTTLYLSTRPIVYKWEEGSAVEFEPLVLELGPVEFAMRHLPSADDQELTGRQCSFRLSNVIDVAGSVLGARLEGKNVVGARVRWYQLLIDRSDLAVPRIDLSSLTGDEAVHFYDGVVEQAELSEDEIVLTCFTELPKFAWPTARGTRTAPRDFGARLPIIYGQQQKQPAINYLVGGVTTLTQTIESDYTGDVNVTDASRFPSSGSFSALIGEEKVTATYVTDTILNISVRSVGGAPALKHFAGDQISELPTSTVFVLAAHESATVRQLYARNILGNLVAFNLGTIDLADTTTISGSTVTSLTMTAGELAQLAVLLNLSISEDATIPQTTTVKVDADSWSFPTDNYAESIGTSGSGIDKLDGTNSTGDRDVARFEFPSSIAADPGNKDVIRWRFGADQIIINTTGTPSYSPIPPSVQVVGHAQNWDGGSPPEHKAVRNNDGTQHSITTGTEVVSAWHTPSGGPLTINDILGSGSPYSPAYVQGEAAGKYGPSLNALGSGLWVRYVGAYLEFEIDEAPVSPPNDTSIKGGYGLELFADLDGIGVPSGASPDYKAGGVGSLITKPCDVLRHWIEEYGGGTVDTDSYDDCNTNLGSNVLAFDARTVGVSFMDVLMRIAFESRTNIIAEPAAGSTVYKMLTAAGGSNYTFGSSVLTLDEWAPGGYREQPADIQLEVATRFQALYDYDASVGNDDSGFTSDVIANPTTSAPTVPTATELANAEKRFGVGETTILFFFCIRDEATAEDVLGYYAHERMRGAVKVILAGVPWWLAYALEPGDICSVTPPWSSTARKIRILGVEKDTRTETLRLAAVEVE